MAGLIICPVCGQETSAEPSNTCELCGALLPSEVLNAAGQPKQPHDQGEAPADAFTPEPQLSPDEQDELIAAFRSQFEGRGIVLPHRWVDRLHALALEVEASRRFASVFFLDLRGYTNLAQQMTDVQ